MSARATRLPFTLPVLLVLCAALAACDHGEPFTPPPNGTDRPFQPSTPTRLTYNPGVDRDPVWLPDGSGILYTAQLADHAQDQCLLLLPPTGGRVSRTICNDATLAQDSLKAYDGAAISAGGLLAFERQSRLPASIGPRFDELAIGTLATVPGATTLQSLPFSIGNRLYTGIAQIRWLGDTAVVYRAGFAGITCIDSGSPCATAFVTSGFDLVTQSLSGGSPVLIPGTTNASSVSAGPDPDVLYYTLLGDSHVYRRVLSTGAVTTFYDFGGGTIARDVQVVGRKVLTVVGGNVSILDVQGIGQLQWDQGGVLVMVDLDTVVTTQISGGPALYLHPAISPDGKHLVVESGGDLWLFDLP